MLPLIPRDNNLITTLVLSSAAEMMELKVCFGPASVKDIEQSIVDYNNSQMENSSLEEQVWSIHCYSYQ